MRLAKRLQINLYLRPVEFISSLSDVNTLVFPVAWLNEVIYLHIFIYKQFVIMFCSTILSH